MLLANASEDMTTQRITDDTHLSGTQRVALSVSKYLGNRRPESEDLAEEGLPNVRREASQNLLRRKV